MESPESRLSEEKQSRPPRGSVGRRTFLGLAAAAVPLALGGVTAFRGTKRLGVEILRLSDDPTVRFVHISDIHHKGDAAYLERVVGIVNGLEPDLVAFTGDLIEETHFLEEALELLADIRAPLFGVPGNHEYWSGAPFDPYERTFNGSGGAWLTNRSVPVPEKDLTIVGVAERETAALQAPRSDRSLLLTHYPIFANEAGEERFTLTLAGHSHGGQVRLPGIERSFVPFGVGPYDRGLFDSPVGPLYVNRGIGTAVVPFRVNCPPEVTLIEL